jgi:hypothetical protein
MTFSARRRLASLFVLALAACSSAPTSTSIEQPAPATEAATATSSPARAAATESAPTTHAEWRKALLTNHASKRGCFRATEPSLTWEEMPCGPATNAPHRVPERLLSREPSTGPGVTPPAAVEHLISGTNAFNVSVAGQGTLADALGWFPFESGGTGESDNNGSAIAPGGNSYELQLNTNTFPTPACNGQSGCQGWEQFIYGANEQQAYIEFSLVGYSGSCPAPYGNSYSISGGRQVCFYNTDYLSPPSVAASNLNKGVMLHAETTNNAVGSPTDYMDFDDGTTVHELIEFSELGLASAWTSAEFNIYGDGNNTQAFFGNPTSLQVQVDTTLKGSTSTAPPSCSSVGQGTSESNTLFLNGSCCTFGRGATGARFSESTSSTAASTFVCPTAPKCTYSFSCAGDGEVAVTCTPDGASPSGTISIYQVVSTGTPQVASKTFTSTVTGPTQVATVATLYSPASETFFACTGSPWGGQVCDKPTTVGTPSCVGQSCDGTGTWQSNGTCCVPRTCETLGTECGQWSNDCGGWVTCGTCPSSMICQSGRCVGTGGSGGTYCKECKATGGICTTHNGVSTCIHE